MDNYNLGSGEIVLAQASPVRLGRDKGGESLKEVVLTNKNLILVNEVSSGLFSSKTYLKRCPPCAALGLAGHASGYGHKASRRLLPAGPFRKRAHIALLPLCA